MSDIRHVVGCSCNQKRLRISERTSRCIRAAPTTHWRRPSSSLTAVRIARWTRTSCATCSTHYSAKWRLHSRQVFWRESNAHAFSIIYSHTRIHFLDANFNTVRGIVHLRVLKNAVLLTLFFELFAVCMFRFVQEMLSLSIITTLQYYI